MPPGEAKNHISRPTHLRYFEWKGSKASQASGAGRPSESDMLEINSSVLFQRGPLYITSMEKACPSKNFSVITLMSAYFDSLLYLLGMICKSISPHLPATLTLSTIRRTSASLLLPLNRLNTCSTLMPS